MAGTRPSSPTRWADTAATNRTAIDTGLRDVGFPSGALIPAGENNQRDYEVGEWLTYLSALSPASDVLDFREWRCPDDSAFTVEWDGPGGVDGLLVATVEELQVDGTDARINMTQELQVSCNGGNAVLTVGNLGGVDPIVLMSSASGIGNTGTIGANGATSTVFMDCFDSAGWTVQMRAIDPGVGSGEATVTIDADSGNVTLESDYGDVETVGDHHADGYAYRTPLPALTFIAKPGFGTLYNASGTVALLGSYGAVEFDTSAATIAGRVALPQIPGSLASGTVTTLTAVVVHYTNLDGATPATCIFRILTLGVSSTPTTLMERQVSTGSPPGSGTLDLVGGTVTSAVVPAGQPLMLEMESVTAGTDVHVSAVVFTFTRTHVD